MINAPKSPAWIALFDILGFENLVESIPGDELGIILESIPRQLEHRFAWTPDEQHVGVTIVFTSDGTA